MIWLKIDKQNIALLFFFWGGAGGDQNFVNCGQTVKASDFSATAFQNNGFCFTVTQTNVDARFDIGRIIKNIPLGSSSTRPQPFFVLYFNGTYNKDFFFFPFFADFLRLLRSLTLSC